MLSSLTLLASFQFCAPSALSSSTYSSRIRLQGQGCASSSGISVKAMASEKKGAGLERVVIVGGGLGGLAAAIQLRKRGINAEIYEKNPTISGGEGTLISLFPNGCRALSEADPELLTKMKNEGLSDLYSCAVTPDGVEIGEWSLSSRMEETYKMPLISILWKHALRILSEAVPDSCKHTGYECYDITQEDDGAVAHFNEGGERIKVKAPLVIGADGLRSVVRTSLFGAISPRDNERTMWRAVIDSSLCSHKALKPGNISTAANGRTVFVVNGVHGKLYWAFSVKDDASDGQTKVRSKDPQEMKQRLLEFYKGWELATHIIQATEPELILERRVTDLPVLPRWSKGSVVLLGDAVHAVTPALGQGANLAFEDGCELASQLSSSSDLRTALERYEEIRKPRVQKVSEASQQTRNQSQDFYDWLYKYGHSDMI